jgi:hypothetical protein
MWKDRLQLQPGETLELTGSKEKGFMGETDVSDYDILDAEGRKVGSVTHECHMAVKGFRISHNVVQRDAAGAVVISQSWRGD